MGPFCTNEEKQCVVTHQAAQTVSPPEMSRVNSIKKSLRFGFGGQPQHAPLLSKHSPQRFLSVGFVLVLGVLTAIATHFDDRP